MRISVAIAFAVIAFAAIASIYSYPLLPDRIAAHWNSTGMADGEMGKLEGLAVLPLVCLAVSALYLFIPKSDRAGLDAMRLAGQYEQSVLLSIIFIIYIHMLLILWNLDYPVNMAQYTAPAFGLIIYINSLFAEKIKIGKGADGNRKAGMTPTAKKAGTEFLKLAAFASVFGLIFPDIVTILIAVPLMLALTTFAFMVFEYEEEAA